MVTTKNENVHFQINPGYKADAMEIDMETSRIHASFQRFIREYSEFFNCRGLHSAVSWRVSGTIKQAETEYR